MTQLAIKHIAGGKFKTYIPTTEKFFDKVFKLNNTSHDFATKEGIFTAKSLSILYENKEKINYTKVSQRKSYIEKSKNAVEGYLTGVMKGSKASKTIKHSAIIKTEEFGGQPVGSKKESKGTVFEREFARRLNECINGKKCVGKYHKSAGHLVEQLEKNIGPIVKIDPLGGQNKSRPLEVQGKQLYIAPHTHQQHGVVLTDIDIVHKNGERTHLSAKFGGTLTFMNPGAKTLFEPNDIKKNDINKIKGKILLETFGIKEDIFCDVFNRFRKVETQNTKKSGTVKVDKIKIKNFLKTAMGSDYWMVHAHDTSEKVDIWRMNPIDVDGKYTTITSDVTVLYGGRTGQGKRVNVEFSSSAFDFILNIRSKSGGLIYPTHVMLDYKTKLIPTKHTI